MTKTIRMRATAARGKEAGFSFASPLGLLPVDVNLSVLSAPARWIAEHVTATYVVDEYSDQCAIIAESAQTMEQRDRAKGMDESRIATFAAFYGKGYTENKMREHVTFPILNKQAPEEVFETVVKQLVQAGAVKLYCGADCFVLEK